MKQRCHALGATFLAAVVSVGCSAMRQASADATIGPAAAPMRAASAELRTPEGLARGQAVLTATPSGVEIVIKTSGLRPGKHGFHVHAQGRCAPGPGPEGDVVAFGAAGAHFDPGRSGKHGQPGGPPELNHAGDLPNLTADASGNASIRYVHPGITLAPGVASVIGRSLIVHADPDDHQTNPAGASGARVLCGVIEPAQFGSSAG